MLRLSPARPISWKVCALREFTGRVKECALTFQCRQTRTSPDGFSRSRSRAGNVRLQAMADNHELQQRDMRSSFEASLPHRLQRASQVKLQNIIPAHWFAAAASECAGMYIAGFFYGAISVAQAYIE